ncbi:acyltransferase [Nocardioides mangrovicus]|uniref:Acyltransferase n=1 Tax=Nocardioides mangrovicus TaxID=2478913 RepID=A0A3L8NYC0_9ACTN|nr:acyltransferase [Nocardioides mangrovicus]RLV47627.1 acyltransferase [Nocardioides mangrovicus]
MSDAAARRDPVLDIGRGVAMVLIVLGHVTRGLAAGEELDPSRTWYVKLDAALYVLHLPLFVLLSGAFVARAATRDGTAAYLRSRLVLLAWLFVVWTVIQGAVQLAPGRLVNTPISWRDILAGLWHPLGELWFLPTLAVLTVVTVLVAPWRSPGRRWALLAVAAAVSLLDWGHFGHWSGIQGMGLAVWYVLGVVVGHARLQAVAHDRRAAPAALVAVAGLVALFVVTTPVNPSDSTVPRTPDGIGAGVLAVVLGLALSCGVARLVAASPLREALAGLGRRSLEVFLAHIAFASGCRIALTHLGVDSLPVLIGAGLLVGLGGSLLLVAITDRVGPRWLFAPPAFLRRPGATAAAAPA